MSLRFDDSEGSGLKHPKLSSKPKEILVVDDDEQIRYLLTEILGCDRYNVVCHSGVKSALADLEKRRPDLVILDLCMKGADGTVFLNNVQQHLPKEISSLPIIVLSVLQDMEMIDFTLRNGVAAYMTKPFDPIKLLETVGSAMNAERGFGSWTNFFVGEGDFANGEGASLEEACLSH